MLSTVFHTARDLCSFNKVDETFEKLSQSFWKCIQILGKNYDFPRGMYEKVKVKKRETLEADM